MITLAAPATYETEIKRSRFIACCARADSPEAARAFVEAHRHAEASHNAWAYRIEGAVRISDDGEVGGTAGRPILHAIEGQELDHVVCLVIRYYGGVKLGAGGLTRAYGGAAAACLRDATRLEVLPTVVVRALVPFDSTGAVFPLLSQYDVKRLDETWESSGLRLELELEEMALGPFEQALADATRGRATLAPG